MRAEPGDDGIGVANELLELRDGANVLGVQVEGVRRAAIGEEAVELLDLAQQAPRHLRSWQARWLGWEPHGPREAVWSQESRHGSLRVSSRGVIKCEV